MNKDAGTARNLNFLEEIIEADLASGKCDSIMTRFPPEPNGYLHIGHAKSICLNFGLAKKYGGKTNLRFDDTNPVKEDTEYVDSIKEDIRWLGFEWENERYASDYFDQLYEWAEELIRKGLAYVDDQTQEEIRATRGTVQTPGTESPWRNRTVEENLRLFREMKAGKYADGEKVLRAKIDMAHPNMLFRDPLMYRIIHAHHHRTGDKWCIYPMYDFAHGECDSIEHITHSICTLEFDVHRPLYDWFIEKLGIFPSHQYEFARLNLTYTVMSKRKLLELVRNHYVSGWDDPRMPTICGIRRRGYTPESIACHYRLGARQGGVVRCPSESCKSGRPVPQGAFYRRNPHREGGFYGGAAQEVFPPETGRGGASEIFVYRQMRGGSEGRLGQYYRNPVFPRSGLEARSRGVAFRQGDDSLGVRIPCKGSGTENIRQAFHRGTDGVYPRGGGLQELSES